MQTAGPPGTRQQQRARCQPPARCRHRCWLSGSPRRTSGDPARPPALQRWRCATRRWPARKRRPPWRRLQPPGRGLRGAGRVLCAALVPGSGGAGSRPGWGSIPRRHLAAPPPAAPPLRQAASERSRRWCCRQRLSRPGRGQPEPHRRSPAPRQAESRRGGARRWWAWVWCRRWTGAAGRRRRPRKWLLRARHLRAFHQQPRARRCTAPPRRPGPASGASESGGPGDEVPRPERGKGPVRTPAQRLSRRLFKRGAPWRAAASREAAAEGGSQPGGRPVCACAPRASRATGWHQKRGLCQQPSAGGRLSRTSCLATPPAPAVSCVWTRTRRCSSTSWRRGGQARVSGGSGRSRE